MFDQKMVVCKIAEKTPRNIAGIVQPTFPKCKGLFGHFPKLIDIVKTCRLSLIWLIETRLVRNEKLF